MDKNNLLLIIDPQNDFCLPQGALYVPDAENDIARLAEFIAKNRPNIEQIILSVDTHHVLDISHPYYWRDASGNTPPPYTQITYADVEKGNWTPVYNKQAATEYLKNLEDEGEFPHVIWPEHCIFGSSGAAVTDELMNKLKNWERKSGKHFEIVEKGLNDKTEMFGIFRANIPDSNDKTTQENKGLLNRLKQYRQITVAGEAKSHCVANSIKQLFPYPEIMKKIILLEDCMSDVTGFETIALPIYEKAEQMGACFMKSTDLSL